MSPAKHSFGKCDRRTDDGQSDPYVSLCFAGDTKCIILYFTLNNKKFLETVCMPDGKHSKAYIPKAKQKNMVVSGHLMI